MPTATAQDIVTKAYSKVGISSPDATESGLALDALNNLLSSWSAEGLILYSITRENFTLVVNDAEYTIGSGGDFDTVRPLRITDAYLRDGTSDYPLTISNIKHYNDISTKTTNGRPERLYFLPEYPLAKILFNYEPDKAYTLHLDSLKALTEFVSLATAIDLPAEFKRALIFNLAIEFEADKNYALPRSVYNIAFESKQAIKDLASANKPLQPVSFDPMITGDSGRYDIFSGRVL